MTKDIIMMKFAIDLATLSKCTERHVAAIITDEYFHQVYSIGINGGPAKGLDCLCTLGGKYGCVHAEAQAIAKSIAADKRKIMFITLSPCAACATLIVNGGFSRVYYLEEWKDPAGLKILQSAGIRVHKLEVANDNNFSRS